MGHKDKRRLLHRGAPVRVANDKYHGAERWTNALSGVVANGVPVSPETHGSGILVTLDGETDPIKVLWSQVDVAEKPRDPRLDILLTDIKPGRWQYRRKFDPESLRELAESIARYGLINPVLVFRAEDGAFELIAGERRWRACLALGLMAVSPGAKNLTGIVCMAAENHFKVIDLIEYHVEVNHAESIPTIAAEVREGSPESFHEIAIIENLQREDITALEEAEGYNSLMYSNDWTQRQLAAALGKSPAYVSQRLGLLDLAEEVKEATAGGEISFTSARALATVPEPAQGAVADLISSLGGDDPASSRQVASLAGAVRRFLDPDRWRPADNDKTTAGKRNRFRLLRYHIRYMMTNDPERAAAVVKELGAANSWGATYLTKSPATIAGTQFQTAEILSVLTGGGDTRQGVAPWWAAFAKLRGDLSCAQCQIGKLDPVPDAPDWAHCPRWAGAEVGTCAAFLKDEDPVWIPLPWQITDAIAGLDHSLEGGAEELGISIELHDGRRFVSDLGQYRRAVIHAIRYHKEREARQEREAREGWLDEIRAFYAAQPRGLGSRFELTNAQSHTCRLCGQYRPDLESELGAPCRFAAEPLRHWYNRDRNRAPMFAVLVRRDGVCVPRCERFTCAEVPSIAPLRGVRFPEDPEGRAEILLWLRRILKRSAIREDDHNGAVVGPLSWLPYDRPDSKAWDPALTADYIRGHWRECGGDRGVARLMTIALSEAEAREQSQIVDLVDPTTADLHSWISVRWDHWTEGRAPANVPDDWPQPWVSESEDQSGLG